MDSAIELDGAFGTQDGVADESLIHERSLVPSLPVINEDRAIMEKLKPCGIVIDNPLHIYRRSSRVRNPDWREDQARFCEVEFMLWWAVKIDFSIYYNYSDWKIKLQEDYVFWADERMSVPMSEPGLVRAGGKRLNVDTVCFILWWQLKVCETGK